MNITLSLDDEVLLLAKQQAESLGTSVDNLVSNYIDQLADTARRNQDVEEFIRLSLESTGIPRTGSLTVTRFMSADDRSAP